MTKPSLIHSIAAIILLFVCIGAVSGTTITAHGGTIPISGSSAEFPITVDSLPEGLSGFSMTVSLSDPSKAEMTAVITASWADISDIGGTMVSGPDTEQSVMADAIGITTATLTADFYPAPNLTLATIRVRADAQGSTQLKITGLDIQDKDGTTINAAIQNGTIVIGNVNPTAAQTESPTATQTESPTTTQTESPTATQTETPTEIQTESPTATQTETPTATQTETPTGTQAEIPAVTSDETGSIDVQSTPPGGDVYLDDDLVGATPVIIDDLSPGQYTILIQKDGYEPFETASVVVSSGNTTPVEAVLEMSPPSGTSGSLDITSIPAGAKVYLDDVYQGKTSLLITNLDPGAYMLRLEKEGYNAWYQGITIVAGETNFINAPLTPTPTTNPTVTLTPTPIMATGGVFVVSEPTATVFIDGVERGRSNEAIDDVPAGVHNITLFKPGYISQSIMVNIPAARVTVTRKVILEAGTGQISPTTAPSSEATTISATPSPTSETTSPAAAGSYPPVPASGGIFVYSVPFGSSVFIDDFYQGTSPNLFGSISPGTHNLKVTLPGYEDNVRPFTVYPGDITMVTVVLAPDFDALISVFS
jgi:hypothetical protein